MKTENSPPVISDEDTLEIQMKRGYFIDKVSCSRPHAAVFIAVFDLRQKFRTAALTSKYVQSNIKSINHNNLSVVHVSHVLDEWASRNIIQRFIQSRKKFYNIPKAGIFGDLFTDEENIKLAKECCKEKQ